MMCDYVQTHGFHEEELNLPLQHIEIHSANFHAISLPVKYA